MADTAAPRQRMSALQKARRRLSLQAKEEASGGNDAADDSVASASAAAADSSAAAQPAPHAPSTSSPQRRGASGPKPPPSAFPASSAKQHPAAGLAPAASFVRRLSFSKKQQPQGQAQAQAQAQTQTQQQLPPQTQQQQNVDNLPPQPSALQLPDDPAPSLPTSHPPPDADTSNAPRPAPTHPLPPIPSSSSTAETGGANNNRPSPDVSYFTSSHILRTAEPDTISVDSDHGAAAPPVISTTAPTPGAEVPSSHLHVPSSASSVPAGPDRRQQSLPRTPTSSGLTLGLDRTRSTNVADTDDPSLASSMGQSKRNGRHSAASAEFQRHHDDLLKATSSTPPVRPAADLRKPTERPPRRSSSLKVEVERLGELTHEPFFVITAVVCLGLTIVTFGWKWIFRLTVYIALPLIARYVIPYPITKAAPADRYPPEASKAGSVTWLNHTLRALFPLISTDILAPFVDLLEDALIQQVPPIVTSVRISSVSLGVEPVLFTSFRPISDDEWFAALVLPRGVPAPVKSENRLSGVSENSNGVRRVSVMAPQPPQPGGVSPSRSVPLSPSPSAHSPEAPRSNGSVPSPIIHPVSDGHARFRDRSFSSSSKISRKSWQSATTDGGPLPSIPSPQVVDSAAQQQIRKRDRMLSRLKRHRSTHGPQAPTSAGSRASANHDDLDAEQYVNYELGFVYRHSPDMGARGKGIHMISHFGWGVRGIGGSEIPVYLDVGQLQGKVRVRVLLSASPPFAREVSFSFVTMPSFDIIARPLRSGSFNAMDIPLIKSYVEKSIAKVASGFVAPKSYTMDVDRLLMGHDNALKTETMGVFHINIRSASNLPRTDTVGTCDPYLAISYSQFNKPLFSTRTIVSTLDPFWDEEAFILVQSSAIATGEKLRLRVCDSDRFSADDLIGLVEVDVAEMVEWATANPNQTMERQDSLQAVRPGMKVQGEVDWAIAFHPLWQMPAAELKKRVEAAHAKRGEGSTPAPPWLKWLDKYVEVPAWEKERAERRKEVLDYFTGERIRDELEAAGKPTAEFPSGVLQFHIHQCADLELESLSGTFSGSAMSRRKSAASGKPALQDVIDRTAADNVNPPNAYCEVHINDKFIYRTRTKQLTPVPYFNAVSERFIRDWRVAKIMFVIKDARDREHDPILGAVSMRLKDALRNGCQVSGWYPLVGGLGWGRLRISLLFKPVDIHLKSNVSSFETATFDLGSITTTTDLLDLAGKQPPVLVIEGEYTRAVLRATTSAEEADRNSVNGSTPEVNEVGQLIPPSRTNSGLSVDKAGKSSIGLMRSLGRKRAASGVGTSALSISHTHSQPSHSGREVEWVSYHSRRPNLHHHHPVRLAILYRHSCSLVFSFVTKRVIKKKKVHAIATLRLSDVRDGELTTRTIPIFATASVRDAMKAVRQFSEAQKFSASVSDHGEAPDPERLSATLGGSIPIVGYAKVTFVLHPGVSRAHRTLAKRNLKFRSVYNAWEAIRSADAGPRLEESSASESGDDTDIDMDLCDLDGADEDGDGFGDDSDSLDGDDDSKARAHAAASKMHSDDTRAMQSARGAHTKALHSSHRGVMGLKLLRTTKFVKDAVEAKVLGAGGSRLDRRPRGMDIEPEYESQSKL